MTLFDDRVCALGEGVLWHPKRQEIFWFDILGKKLHSKHKNYDFDWHVSAAGWVSDTELLVASSVGLHRLDLESGEHAQICELEASNNITRSNDGRADPWGGFWISTMGLSAQEKAGAIYRYYRGELRQLHKDITIPNAICFSPDRQFAYFADSMQKLIFRQALEAEHGWPSNAPEIWLDLTDKDFEPDGAVIDARGNMWNAQWGASRVACYDEHGQFIKAVEFNATQTSCPGFGGENLSDLYVTSATVGLDADGLKDDGKLFCATNVGQGQQEHQVII